MSRPVVVADVVGLVALLRPVRGCRLDEVERLVRRAGVIDYKTTATSVIVGARHVADVEAYAETSRDGWIVQRARKRGRR